jgi:hypothetical protein
MQFVHWREYLDAGDIVVVNCSHRCNVSLMSDSDFESYRRGGTHRYHGGHYERLPARIAAPSSGYWNIALDLGGGSASIRHSMNVWKAA